MAELNNVALLPSLLQKNNSRPVADHRGRFPPSVEI
jgi:hypothetical protein